MKGTAEEFHQGAQRYYEACFGPESDRVKRHEAILKAEEHGDYDAVDELRQEEAEDVLSVEQLTHSFRGNCEWEILITAGGPAARVLVQVDINGEVQWATFQYQDWFQPWYSPENQDHRMPPTGRVPTSRWSVGIAQRRTVAGNPSDLRF